MKLPPDVGFRKDFHLLVWKPRGILNPEMVNEMISSMYHEGIFQPEMRAQTLQKGRGESGTEYELLVVYRPRSGYAHENVAEVTPATTGSEGAR